MLGQCVAMAGWFFAKDTYTCMGFKNAATLGLEMKP